MIILRQRYFSLFGKLRDLGDRYEKWKNPNYKTQKEIQEERVKQIRLDREKEEKDKQDKFCAISRQHKILMDIERKVSKYHPSWGDGDEFPFLKLWWYYPSEENFGNVSLGLQNQEEYRWNGKCWEEIYPSKTPRKINNLKQELLKQINKYIKEWKEIDYLDSEDIEEVLIYLENLKNEIKKSSL